MVHANSLLTLLVAGLQITPVSAQTESTAEQFLHRSMQRQFSVNVVALLVQRDPTGDGRTQVVRVERDRAGRIHHVVVAPLRLQGTETIDDGKRARTFWPDQNVVIDQESPQLTPCDANWRMDLVKQNYRVRFGKSTKIAGRDARQVIATPKDKRMDTRTVSVDRATSYPLRLETTSPDGSTTVHFDTKEIKFPASIPPEHFEMRVVGSVRKLAYSRPTVLTRDLAKEKIGFAPLMPAEMPMGFQLQEIQLTQSTAWRSIAIRITDGLVRATIYQWRSKPGEAKLVSMENSSQRDVGAVRMMVVTDLGEDLREALLQAFAEGGETSFGLGGSWTISARPRSEGAKELSTSLSSFCPLPGPKIYWIQTDRPSLRFR